MGETFLADPGRSSHGVARGSSAAASASRERPKLRFADARRARRAAALVRVDAAWRRPIQLANVYVFEDLDQVDAVWEGREAGYVYGRFGTPNHTMLEETLAALEGGESGLVVASGMGALSAFLLGGSPRPGTTSSPGRTSTARPPPSSESKPRDGGSA